MTFAIINNITNKIMERAENFKEANEIKEQYNEMGNWQDVFGNNEYFGTYRVEAI